MNKALLLAGGLILSSGAPAFADTEHYDWSGYYVGITGGVATGTTNYPSTPTILLDNAFADLSTQDGRDFADFILSNFFDVCPCDLDYDSASLVDDEWQMPLDGYWGNGATSFSGGVISVHAGHNWQNGPFVYGVEADIQAGDLKGKQQFLSQFLIPVNYITQTRIDWMGTVRGRAGLAHGKLLGYATAGLALARTTSEIGVGGTAGPYENEYDLLSGATDTRVGLAIGGGVETALTDRLTLRMEYLYSDFGTKDLPSYRLKEGELGLASKFRSDVAFHTIRGGFSIRF